MYEAPSIDSAPVPGASELDMPPESQAGVAISSSAYPALSLWLTWRQPHTGGGTSKHIEARPTSSFFPGRDVPGLGVVAVASTFQCASAHAVGNGRSLRRIRRRHTICGHRAGSDAGSGLFRDPLCTSHVVERHTLRTLHSGWGALARRRTESMDQTIEPRRLTTRWSRRRAYHRLNDPSNLSAAAHRGR